MSDVVYQPTIRIVRTKEGPSGPIGPRGYSILSGHRAPGPGDGTNGDFWLNLDTFEFYGPKASGAWPSPIPLGDAGEASRAESAEAALAAAITTAQAAAEAFAASADSVVLSSAEAAAASALTTFEATLGTASTHPASDFDAAGTAASAAAAVLASAEAYTDAHTFTTGLDLFVFPSGDVTGAADTTTINAAVAALGALPTGGTVHLGTSQAHPDWHVTTPAGINSIGIDMTLGGTVRNVSIVGGDSACTTVYTVGTGMHFFNHPSAADQSKDKGVSVIEKLAIDNSLNTHVGAVGVDWGDFQGAAPDDLLIRNFSNGLNSTTIATQVDVSTLTGTQSVNVASTSTLAASGVVRVFITEGSRVCVRTIRYTAKDATHLLNCTCMGAPSGSLALVAAPVWQASVGATTITSPIADVTTLTGSGTVTVASTAALVAPGWIMTDTSAGVVAIAFTTIASATTVTGAKVSSSVAAGTSVAAGASAWQTTGVDCALRLRSISSVPTEKFKPSNMVLVNNAVHVKFLPVTGNYSFDYQNWDGVEVRNVADFQMGFSIEGSSLVVGDTWTSIIGNNLAHYNTLFNVQDSATVYDAQFNGCANEKTGSSGSNVMTFNIVATSPNAATSPTFSWNGGSRMLMIGSTSYLGGASGLTAPWVSGVTQHITGSGSQTLDCCGTADNGHGGLQGPLDAFFCRMTGDMSTTITNPSGGQLVTLIVNQDGTGGHVFTPPANWTGGVFPQNVAANSLCSATAIYNAVSAKFVQVASSSPLDTSTALIPLASPVTSATTLKPYDLAPVNVTGGTVPLLLPNSPPDQTLCAAKIVAGGGGANTCTVTTQGSDLFNVSGGLTVQTLRLQNQGQIYQYQAASGLWLVISESLPLGSIDGRYFQLSNNLFELAGSPGPAQANLGLGSAATHASTDFDTAGAAAAVSSALTAFEATLGTASTHPASDFDTAGAAAAVLATSAQKGANLSDLASSGAGRLNLDMQWLGSCNAVAQANINVAVAGAGPFDNYTPSAGDKLLLTGQTSGPENGPWVWNGAGVAMTRPTDWPTGAVVSTPRLVAITNGSNLGSIWRLTTTGAITVGTTATAWAVMDPRAGQVQSLNFAGGAAQVLLQAAKSWQIVMCDTSGGAFQVTVAAASTGAGSRVTLIKTTSDANLLTVASGQNINGSATYTPTLGTLGSWVTLCSDGTNWFVVDASTPGPVSVSAVKTSAYTATLADYLIPLDPSSGAFNLTLLTAVGIKGIGFVLKNVSDSANLVGIATTSAQTVDGQASAVIQIGPRQAVTVMSDGANWMIL